MKRLLLILLCACLLTGCGRNDTYQKKQDASYTKEEKSSTDNNKDAIADSGSSGEREEVKPEILHFRDVFGAEYQVEINKNVKPCQYDKDLFRHEGDKLFYDDETYDCALGIDVSYHQGYIDWQQVKEQGFDFAFLRIAYRGYGQEGVLKTDTEFERNLQNAQGAGLSVGVYFFAQAINEQEAKEEADFVLSLLNQRHLELPVVYDPESILDDEARTDDVTGEQFTKNTEVFCNAIREAGYEPMIYSNMLWEAYKLDLEYLKDFPIWYADYEAKPQTPYDFTFWQYSNQGKVGGVSGNVDLDIWMKKQE